jgi:hypothetical protein
MVQFAPRDERHNLIGQRSPDRFAGLAIRGRRAEEQRRE